MDMVKIIEKKKLKKPLTKEECDFVAKEAAQNNQIDYQLAALLMAIRLNGMNPEETTHLTLAMAESGDMVNLSKIKGIPVDKHSTGGVGDTTTLILVPLVAACGAPVAKMSGRGLGHTGGTLDKLESIKGFKIELSEEEFIKQVQEIGCAVIGQSSNIAPADKKIYALRDVTSTVDSLPLIASSIMSKKLASGSKGIVLDVKTGAGALMPTLEESIELAQEMVEIGRLSGRNTMAVITDMDEPLGSHVGNSLEVKDAIDVLAGRTQGPLLEVSLILGSYMLLVSGVTQTQEEGYKKLLQALNQGKGLKKLKEMIIAQGGDGRVCDSPELLPQSKTKVFVEAKTSGYIQKMDTISLGIIAQELGAGRKEKEDVIDPAVGFVLHKRIGEKIEKGEILATIHSSSKEKGDRAKEGIVKALVIGKEAIFPKPLVLAIVEQEGKVKKFI